MSAQEKPQWIPNWEKEKDYPDLKTTSPRQWAWEFLRRSPSYQNDYVEFEKKIIPEINKQAKKGIITSETAQMFISDIEQKGADCLMPNLKIPATKFEGGYESGPEYKLWLHSWFDEHCSASDLLENWERPIPEIIDPQWHREFCERYRLRIMHNPATNSAPIFIENQFSPAVPLAYKYGLVQHLSPQTENEIAFMVDLDKSLKEQIKFIYELCKQLLVKKKKGDSGAKQKEWQKQLRLLDADRYGPSTARRILADEWRCSRSNLSHKKDEAVKNMCSGYRQIACRNDKTVNDPQLVASMIKLQRSMGKIELCSEDNLEEYQREVQQKRSEALKKLRQQ